MKRLLIIVLIFFTAFFLLPAVIVMIFSGAGHHAPHQSHKTSSVAKASKKDLGPSIAVYRSQSQKTEKVPLESYIIGVVASEMPANFKPEALKAQALAARTYILRQMSAGKPASFPGDAQVTDTTANQVYKNKAELKKQWGKAFQKKYEKVAKAVESTKGQVITYKGQLITPSFFSTSNGFTENAEDYWVNPIPYLKSVPSPWDVNSPKYLKEITLPVKKAEALLGVQIRSADGKIGKVMAYTEGHRIERYKIGGKTFTGRQIREKLGLPSTDFTMTEKGQSLHIETKGFGHGVGMSQYGANALASKGKSYKDILSYYYRGTTITAWKNTDISRMTALKK